MKTDIPEQALPSDEELLRRGYDALIRELGMAGMIRFMWHFDHGSGDYTQERRDMFKGETVQSIAQRIRDRRTMDTPAFSSATPAADEP